MCITTGTCLDVADGNTGRCWQITSGSRSPRTIFPTFSIVGSGIVLQWTPSHPPARNARGLGLILQHSRDLCGTANSLGEFRGSCVNFPALLCTGRAERHRKDPSSPDGTTEQSRRQQSYLLSAAHILFGRNSVEQNQTVAVHVVALCLLCVSTKWVCICCYCVFCFLTRVVRIRTGCHVVMHVLAHRIVYMRYIYGLVNMFVFLHIPVLNI